MATTLDPATVAEISSRLEQIQAACREYVVQSEAERKMTFASIRIAADAVAALCEESSRGPLGERVREEVNAINAEVDELAGRFGSDEPGRCRVCGAPLQTAGLSGGDHLSYCTSCPRGILGAVREVSDLTGAEAL